MWLYLLGIHLRWGGEKTSMRYFTGFAVSLCRTFHYSYASVFRRSDYNIYIQNKLILPGKTGEILMQKNK